MNWAPAQSSWHKTPAREFIQRALTARHDPRKVVADPDARYFGARLDERSLVPADGARLGETRFEDWLSQSLRERQP